MNRRVCWIVAALALATTCYGTALGVFWARNGKGLIEVFWIGIPAWAGYLIAHYCYTGRFIDPDGQSRSFNFPNKGINRVLVFIGIAGMVLAVPGGIYALHFQSFTGTLLATTTFVGSYMWTHARVTGKPL